MNVITFALSFEEIRVGLMAMGVVILYELFWR